MYSQFYGVPVHKGECVHADVSSKCVIPSLYLVERYEAGRRKDKKEGWLEVRNGGR